MLQIRQGVVTLKNLILSLKILNKRHNLLLCKCLYCLILVSNRIWVFKKWSSFKRNLTFSSIFKLLEDRVFVQERAAPQKRHPPLRLWIILIYEKLFFFAQDFIDARGYPAWIQVDRVVDGGESPLFKQYFPDWDEGNVPMPGQPTSGSNVAGNSNITIITCFINLTVNRT